jgi:hypothetical protein
MTVHDIPLVKADDSYTPRWVTPENLVLRGGFRHNPYSPFQVVIFESRELFEDWHGCAKGHYAPPDRIGDLSAQATVISNPPAPAKDIISVQTGDVLRTPLGNYEIATTGRSMTHIW